MVDPAINGLGLCAGVGMLDEGVRLALEYFGIQYHTAAYAEWEGYPAQQLISLMETGALDPAPVWCGDFADLDWKAFHGVVDAFVAGYPCQAWSTAGKRLGFADKRWVWGHIEYGLSVVRPRFVYLENVRGLISGGGLGATIAGLSRLGYDTEWSTLYASSVGASHQRDRIFIFGFLADDIGKQSRRGGTRAIPARRRESGIRGKDMAAERTLADRAGIRRRGEPSTRQQSNAGLRGKGVVNSDGKLHIAGNRHELQSRTAADAGDKVEYRQRQTRKPEGKAAGTKSTKASKHVDWEKELLFAPGQNDPRWDQIIRERPDLAPTLEPEFYRSPDGLAGTLDERERRLRCCGNGVVAIQSAVAYINLMRRAGIGQ